MATNATSIQRRSIRYDAAVCYQLARQTRRLTSQNIVGIKLSR
jgi:hypothetical protein